MHSHPVTDRDETSVCTVCKKQRQRRVDAVLVLIDLQIKERRRAKEILS